jgi:hypothetical protein
MAKREVSEAIFTDIYRYLLISVELRRYQASIYMKNISPRYIPIFIYIYRYLSIYTDIYRYQVNFMAKRAVSEAPVSSLEAVRNVLISSCVQILYVYIGIYRYISRPYIRRPRGCAQRPHILLCPDAIRIHWYILVFIYCTYRIVYISVCRAVYIYIYICIYISIHTYIHTYIYISVC